MVKKKKQIISFILILGLFMSVIFGCILAAQNSFMAHDNHHTTMAACCDINFIFGGASHNIPLVLGSNNMLHLLLLVAVVLYLFIKNDNLIYDHVIKSYFKTRDRYGGFNLFYYFILLFSKGILHPKIY